MIVPQWVIGCGYTTLQRLFHLLRPLGRWLGSTILIKLMYAKNAASIPGTSMTYVLNKSLEKTKGLSYTHQGAFVTYAKIYGESSNTVVVIVP